jgi:hypothetical protein
MKIRILLGWSEIIMAAVLMLLMASVPTPLLAQDSPDDDHLVFLPLIANDYDSAWHWTSVVTPTLTPSAYSAPLLAIDRAGQVHLLWDTLSTNARFIYHSYLTSQSWTTPTAILPTLGTSSVLYPPLVDTSGALHLLWKNVLVSNSPARLLYSSFEGGAWHPEEVVYTATSPSYSVQGMVHSGAQSVLHTTVAVSFLSTDVYYTTRTPTGWTAPFEIAPTRSPSLIWPDQLGGVHLYNDSYAGNVYYSYWRNNQFSVDNRQTSGKVAGRNSQLDGLNNLHVFWSDAVPIPGGSVTGLYHQCFVNNQTWESSQVLTGQESLVGSAVKASDGNGGVALAWRQGNKVQLTLWDGCVQTARKTMPMPSGTWNLRAVALRDNPKKACLLFSPLYTLTYNVICAEIVR